MRIHAEHNRAGRIRNVPIGTNEEIRSSIIPRHRELATITLYLRVHFFASDMKTISDKALTRSDLQRVRSSRLRVSLNAVDRPRAMVQAFSEIASADHRNLAKF